MANKKSNHPFPPQLVGKNVYLRPATAEDVANTYHWYLLSDPAMQTTGPHPFKSPAEAAEEYRQRKMTTDRQLFVIVRQKDNQPVGIIRFYDLNSLNRSTEIGLLVDPDERRHGYALEAAHLLCRYLFRSRDLNKVHARTSSLNTGAVALLEKAGFKRDGTLRHHHFYEGEFHDSYIYSMLRFEFD